MASLPLPSAFLFLSLLLSTSLTAHGGNTLSFPPAEAPHPPHRHHRHHPTLPPTPPPSHPHPPPPPPSHPHPPPPPPSHPPPPSYTHPPTPHPVPTPPAKPPVQPPSHPPVKPPSHPPVYPPQRKKVAIQGVVYCKSCKYRGFPTLLGASPLAGAVVKLECNNTRYPLREVKKTDKNGYFFFMPQALTTSGSHKCKVSLVSSPLVKCSVPTSLHGGASGAILFRSPVPKPLPFELFTVGPFAFDAPKKLRCPY